MFFQMVCSPSSRYFFHVLQIKAIVARSFGSESIPNMRSEISFDNEAKDHVGAADATGRVTFITERGCELSIPFGGGFSNRKTYKKQRKHLHQPTMKCTNIPVRSR